MMTSTSGCSPSKASATEEEQEDELKDRYEKFLVDFRKGHQYYTPEEKKKRFEIFKKRVRDIERHNLTCHPWEKQGINSNADVELKEYGGFFIGTPPSTSSVSILPTQLKGHVGLLDCAGRTYKETEYTAFPKEVFDLVDACVKFQEDSARKDDEKNQVVTQQDSAPKDEENLASFTEDELKDRYEKFLVDFRKGHQYYTPEEKQKRFEIFKKRVRDIERHNLTCHPWEKQGINSNADVELKEYGGFFMGTPPSTSSVSILPTQLKGHGSLLDCAGRTYKETEYTAFPKEVFDLLDACVKFQEDSARKDDEKNQVVNQQDSAPKDEETQEVLDDQERANAGLKRRKESFIDRKKQKLDVEEGKNGMQSSFLHMASTERKTAYDDTLRLLEEPNKLEMEIEGLKGKMVNSTLEEQIKKINDELETKIKREEEALRKVRRLVAEQQLEQSKGTLKVMKHVDNEDDPELQEQDKKDE